MSLDASLDNHNGFLQFEKLKGNFEWFYSNYEELKESYDDQYVAIKDERAIDNDYDFELLLHRLNIRNCDESVAIEYVKA